MEEIRSVRVSRQNNRPLARPWCKEVEMELHLGKGSLAVGDKDEGRDQKKPRFVIVARMPKDFSPAR
jgi:hypothetical protein